MPWTLNRRKRAGHQSAILTSSAQAGGETAKKKLEKQVLPVGRKLAHNAFWDDAIEGLCDPSDLLFASTGGISAILTRSAPK